MQFSRVLDLRLTLSLLLVITDIALTLRDVNVTIPSPIKKGENVELICWYDMEGDILYSIKWYKGKREFYRFTPKENPAMKTFPVSEINVERSLSNESHLTLTSVEPIISGKYSCEVSADAPSFHTSIVSGELEVVDVPLSSPSVTGIDPKYQSGEILRGNCTSKYSKPAANLTWTINNILATFDHVRTYPTIKDDLTNLETSTIGIHFLVTPEHFTNGKLKIRCTAKIHSVYNNSIEVSIEEERPRVLLASAAPVGHNVKAYQSLFDQSSLHDMNEMGDLNDPYMTHIQADMSSSSRSDIRLLQHAGISFITIIFNIYRLIQQIQQQLNLNQHHPHHHFHHLHYHHQQLQQQYQLLL